MTVLSIFSNGTHHLNCGLNRVGFFLCVYICIFICVHDCVRMYVFMRVSMCVCMHLCPWRIYMRHCCMAVSVLVCISQCHFFVCVNVTTLIFCLPAACARLTLYCYWKRWRCCERLIGMRTNRNLDAAPLSRPMQGLNIDFKKYGQRHQKARP